MNREIKLANGEILTVEVRPGFYDKIRTQFMLSKEQDVSDEHIKMFIFGAVKSAIDKAEGES